MILETDRPESERCVSYNYISQTRQDKCCVLLFGCLVLVVISSLLSDIDRAPSGAATLGQTDRL